MNFNIPKTMNHLKVDERGYPIPFFVPIVQGKPEFRYMDKTKHSLAIDNSLCHVCGKKLHKDYHYFISGPMGLHNQVSSDAAMHRECAEFALAVCPHMIYQKAERKIEDPNHPMAEIMKDKPDYLFLIKSNKYKAKFYPEFGYRLIHYKAVSSEKYIYNNNKLVKQINRIREVIELRIFLLAVVLPHCIKILIMEDLKKRLLASIDAHGKSDITGVYNLYPHEKKFTILRALFILQFEGWVYVRKHQMIDGMKYPRPNVRRSRKKMYTQLSLLNPIDS